MLNNSYLILHNTIWCLPLKSPWVYFRKYEVPSIIFDCRANSSKTTLCDRAKFLKTRHWSPKIKSTKLTSWNTSISTSNYTVFVESFVWQRENTLPCSLPAHSLHLLAERSLRFVVSYFRPRENTLAFAKAMQATEQHVREARFKSVLLYSRVFLDVDKTRFQTEFKTWQRASGRSQMSNFGQKIWNLSSHAQVSLIHGWPILGNIRSHAVRHSFQCYTTVVLTFYSWKGTSFYLKFFIILFWNQKNF